MKLNSGEMIKKIRNDMGMTGNLQKIFKEFGNLNYAHCDLKKRIQKK